MKEHAHPNQQSIQTKRSPWTGFVVYSAVTECSENMSDAQRVQFLGDLAQRLSALQEWDRFDRFSPPMATLKMGYRHVCTLKGHTGRINSVHALPKGEIISGSVDGDILLWRPTGANRWDSEVLNRQTGEISVVQGLPDRRIVSGSYDGTVRLWARKGQAWVVESTIQYPSGVSCLQALPDESILTGHLWGELIRSRPTRDGGWEQERIGQGKWVRALHYMPNGRIVTGHEGGDIRLWSRGSIGAWDMRRINSTGKDIAGVHALSDGHVFSGDLNHFVRFNAFHDDGTASVSLVGCHSNSVLCLQALSAERIVTGSRDWTIRIWQRDPKGTWQHESVEAQGAVSCLQVFADGRIVSGDTDGNIRVWDGTPVGDGGAS